MEEQEIVVPEQEVRITLPEVILRGEESLLAQANKTVMQALLTVIPTVAEVAVAALLREHDQAEVAEDIAREVFEWVNPNDDIDDSYRAITSLASRATEGLEFALDEAEAVPANA